MCTSSLHQRHTCSVASLSAARPADGSGAVVAATAAAAGAGAGRPAAALARAASRSASSRLTSSSAIRRKNRHVELMRKHARQAPCVMPCMLHRQQHSCLHEEASSLNAYNNFHCTTQSTKHKHGHRQGSPRQRLPPCLPFQGPCGKRSPEPKPRGAPAPHLLALSSRC